MIPYKQTQNTDLLFAVFLRSDGNFWQFIAGGGEEGEIPIETARREAEEEAGIPQSARFIPLDSVATIPVPGVTGGPMRWGESVLVIPEHCFCVEIGSEKLHISFEHVEYRWVPFEEAYEMLKWDSNKCALWELNYRIVNRQISRGDEEHK